MKNTIKKLLTVVLCICIFVVGNGNVYAQDTETIDEIADRLIVFSLEEHDDYIIKTYKNITSFVREVKENIPYYTDVEIGGFLVEYTGQGMAEDYDIPYLVEITNYIEINVQEEYMKAEEDGTTSSVSKEEVLTALMNDLIMPASDPIYNYWSSDDGYVRIQTIYQLSKTSGNKKYYVVVAKAEWLKLPLCRFKDVICLANTAVYDDSYNDYARYIQKTSCCNHNGTSHYDKNLTEEKRANGEGSGVKFLYPSTNGVGAEVNLRVTTCEHPDYPGGHNEKLNNMNALVRYRIICEKGKSYNIRSAYSHQTIATGNIDFSVSVRALSISFSGGGGKTNYFPRPVTINA